MRPAPLAALALLTTAVGAAAQDGARETAPVVFRDVSVLTMEADTALPHRTVLVEGDTIAWIGPADGAPIPEGATVIEGAGRTLLPGLSDFHAHTSPADLPLFLANGITTIREMNGTPGHLALRDSIAAGSRLGPRLIVASPLLAGEKQPWRHVLVPDAATARRVARESKALGYDFLKVYDGLSASSYGALAEASKSLGIPLVGHVPKDVGLDGVLAAGQRSIEHVEQIVYATAGHDLDPARIPAIVDRIAGTGVWVVPTLASQRMLALRATGEYAERFYAPEVRYVPKELRAWWGTLRPPAGAPPEGLAADDPVRLRHEAFYAFQRDLTAALHEAGVPMLVGTDTPNPLLVPGFSLHDELDALLEAGFSPIEVLCAATRAGARFMGKEGAWGVVAPGAAADLVLVDGDPLERIGVLRAPVGVMVRGTWLDRDALDRLLDEADPGEEWHAPEE